MTLGVITAPAPFNFDHCVARTAGTPYGAASL
jgi:hypothetical protein